MKSTSQILTIAIAGFAFIFQSAATATVIYEDNFNGANGTLLNGRAPNVVNTGNQTYTATTVLQLSGNGTAVSTSGVGSASIAMPTLISSDVITMEAVLRPRNTANNWMGFGFTDVVGSLATDGIAWAFLRGGTHSNGGRVTVNSGDGTTGLLYSSTAAEAGWAGAIDPSTMKLTYTVATGNLKVELGTQTVFQGLIAYGGVADTAAPLSALNYFTFQWNTQLNDASATPGYFDSIKVSVVPEPSTWALLAGSLTALVVFRRRRLRA